MTDLEFLDSLPRAVGQFVGRTPLALEEVSADQLARLEAIASARLPDAAIVHAPLSFAAREEARMLLSISPIKLR